MSAPKPFGGLGVGIPFDTPRPPPPPDYTWYEQIMVALGLTTPLTRFLTFTTATTLIVWAVKPSVSFNKYGVARDFLVTNPKAKDGTFIPWWLPPLVIGGVTSLFI